MGLLCLLARLKVFNEHWIQFQQTKSCAKLFLVKLISHLEVESYARSLQVWIERFYVGIEMVKYSGSAKKKVSALTNFLSFEVKLLHFAIFNLPTCQVLICCYNLIYIYISRTLFCLRFSIKDRVFWFVPCVFSLK